MDFASFRFFCTRKTVISAVIPPLRKKARSAHLFACKRAHVGSLPLPPFCGLEKQKYSEETGSNASGSEQSDPGFLTGRWFKRCPFSFVFMLKVSAIATEVNSRVAALTGTSLSAASSEWTLLHSGFSAKEKPSYPPSFLLFAKRHARLTCSLASALTLARCRYHLFAA